VFLNVVVYNYSELRFLQDTENAWRHRSLFRSEMGLYKQMEESYIGKLIEYERVRQGISADTVCSGLCDLNMYDRLEQGEDIGDIHVVRIVLQRLGISAGLAGRYLCRDEYDEMSARFNILEYLRVNQLIEAEDAVKKYESQYCAHNNLNRQFRMYMEARIAEFHGDREKALMQYAAAATLTIGDYRGTEFTCISMYEYFLLANVARLDALLGHTAEAELLYERLLAYIKRKKVDLWTMACIYPKTICEMLRINTPQNMGSYDRQIWLDECNEAVRILRDTERLHFISPLLRNRRTLLELLGEKADEQWDEFLEHYEWIRDKYNVTGELLEWYPYYNSDWELYPVEKLIDERRRLYGMTVEELADGVCATETVSRIINRRVSPKHSTVEALLDKLGLRGVLSENVIVSGDWEAHRLWNYMVQSQSINDYVTGKKLNNRLKKMIDANIPINKRVLDYKNVEIKMSENAEDYKEYALMHEKMLGFCIEDINKLTIFTKIEIMIINRYFYCMDKVRDYSKLGALKTMCDIYRGNLGRAFACDCEGIFARCANFMGNEGDFDFSNIYSELGIMLELHCERTYCLSSLIYCIPWNNNVESGEKVSEDDIKMCECAYWIAWMLREKGRMEWYKHWIENHSVE
jgi:transcriptional regulator with XRE-family HTH domain